MASSPSPHVNRPLHSAQAAVATPFIALSAVMGFRPMLNMPLAFVSDTEVLYAAGPRTIIRLDMETKQQLIITSDGDVAAVTAFALAPSRRALAVAELTLAGVPVVSVYEWSFVDPEENAGTLPGWNAPPTIVKRRKRVLSGLDLGSAAVTSLVFSRDSRFLVVLSSLPTVNMFWVEWTVSTGGRLAATHRDIFYPVPSGRVAQIDFAHREDAVVACSGPALLKFFHFNEVVKKSGIEETIKSETLQLRRAAPNFTAHAWLPEGRFLAATATGALWLFVRSELVATLLPPPAGNLPIHSLVPVGTRGFIVGCEGGVLRFYEKSVDARAYFRAVKGMAVMPHEQRLGPDALAHAPAHAPAHDSESGGGGGLESNVSLANTIARSRSRVVALALSPSADCISVVTACGDMMLLDLSEADRSSRAALADGSIFKKIIETHSLWCGSMGIPAAGMSAQSRASILAGTAAGAPPLMDACLGTAIAVLAVSPGYSAATRPPPPTGIIALCVAVSRPLAVTIGADRKIIVWTLFSVGGSGSAEPESVDNIGSVVQCPGSGAHVFSQMPTPALSLTLVEAPVALALHPAGLLALVSTETSIHVCSIMLDAIIVTRTISMRLVTCAAFSHFGGLVALASGNNITILHGVTFAPFTVLRGCTDRICHVLWDRDDRSLISAARDGDVRRWAVVVPNAVSTGIVPVSAASSVMPSSATVAEFLRVGDATVVPDANGLTPPLSLVGRVIAQANVRELSITALSLGHGSHDFLVAGVPREGPGSSNAAAHPKGVSFGSETVGNAAASAAAAPPAGPQIRVLDLVPTSAIGIASASSSSPSANTPTVYALDAPALSLCVATYGRATDRTRIVFAALGHAPATYKRKPGDAPATSDPAGALRAMRLPLCPAPHPRGTPPVAIPLPLYFDSIVGHGGPVTAVCSMPGDDSIIVSGGADGSLAIWHVAGTQLLAAVQAKASTLNSTGSTATSAMLLQGGPNAPWSHDSISRLAPPPQERGAWLAYSDEVLVQAAVLRKSAAEMADVASRVGNVEAAQRFNERQREREYVAQIEAAQTKFATELDAAHEMTQAVETMGIEAVARLARDSMEVASQRYAALEALRESYAQKLEREAARCSNLSLERDRLIALGLEEAADCANSRATSLAVIKSRSETNLFDRSNLQATAIAKQAGFELSLVTNMRAAEDDLDTELEEARFGFEARVAAEAVAGGTLKGEHAFLQRKAGAAAAALAASALELEMGKQRDMQLAVNNMTLTKDISLLRKEISERDARICEKDMQMVDLRKKIHELEKFK